MNFTVQKPFIHKNFLGVFFSLPWCCILPAVFSLVGFAAGISVVGFWSAELIPLFFVASLFFILRAFWLIYIKRQGNHTSVVITWISTIFTGIVWSVRFGVIQLMLMVIIFLGSAFVFNPGTAIAHEPVFGIGPETIFKGGVGLESAMDFVTSSSQQTIGFTNEFIYGLKENISISGQIPYITGKKIAGSASSSGIGDMALRMKYRFFKRDKLGASYKTTLIGGIKFPTGDERKSPSLGTGSTDYLIGITAGYESRKWYYFTTARYIFNNTDGKQKNGDLLLYDFAFGLRPRQRSYYESDLVLLVEFSGEHRDNDTESGIITINSGGDILYGGPTFLWSKRNWMIKGGIQVSLTDNVMGNRNKEDFRNVFAVEYHF